MPSWFRPRTLLQFAGLLILAALAFFGIDFSEAFEAIGDADWRLVVAAFLVLNVALLLRAHRWYLLARGCGLNYEKLYDYYAVFYAGWLANWLLPQGLGSAARLAVVSDTGRSLGRGLAAVIIERLSDVTAAALVGLALLPYVIDSGQGTFFAVLIGIACGGMLVLLALVLSLRSSSKRLRRRLEGSGFGRRLLEVGDETLSALGVIGRTDLVFAGILSLAINLVTAAALYIAALSLDIDVSLALIVAAWSVVALSNILPISIQGLGPREGILIVALVGGGESREAGVALGLLWFALLTVSRLPGIFGWLHRPTMAGTQTTTQVAAR
jgi:glycosyltransferase 2 family protein